MLFVKTEVLIPLQPLQRPRSFLVRFFDNPYQTVLIASIIGLSYFFVAYPLRLAHDAAIFLDAASRLLQGQRLNIDFVDINMPTFHYLNVIPVLISQITHIHIAFVFDLFVLTYLIFACAVLVLILRKAFENRDLFAVYIIPFILVFKSIQLFKQPIIPAFGQREHFILLMFVPYLVLRWHRWHGGNANRGIAFLVGFNACLAATIKPFTLPMFVIADIYWLVTKRKVKPFRQPEIYGAMIFAFLFIAYVVLINPEGTRLYFTMLVPSSSGYDAYYITGPVPTVVSMLTTDTFLQLEILLGLVACVIAIRSKHKLGSLLLPMALALWMAAAAFVIQRKGWTYHRIPLDALAFMLFWLILYCGLLSLQSRLGGSFRYFVTRHLWTGILILLIIAFVINNDALAKVPLEASVPEFNAMIERYTLPNEKVMLLDTETEPSYPGIMQLSRQYIASYQIAYALPMGFYRQSGPDIYNHPTYPMLVQSFTDKTRQDIVEKQPDLILIRSGYCFACPAEFTITGFLESRGLMELIRSHYTLVDNAINFDIYRRK